MKLYELTTNEKRTGNAEAINDTYYEYHGEHADTLDNECNYGYTITEGVWTT